MKPQLNWLKRQYCRNVLDPVGTWVVIQGWSVPLFCFLKAYDIRLVFAYQDITIPSVTSQTPGVPLQNCGSHYDLGCLATWPFLWLRSGAAFVIGDMTGTTVWPLPHQFQLPARSWTLIWNVWGASLGSSIVPIWAGDMVARRPAVQALSVRPCGPTRQGVCGPLPQGWCCGHFPWVWCFGHQQKGCQGGHHPPCSALKSYITAHRQLISAFEKHSVIC